MSFADEWRADDELAHEWLQYLGGPRGAAEMAQHMGCNEQRAGLAMTRLVWRGLAEMGPSCWRGARPQSRWQAVDPRGGER